MKILVTGGSGMVGQHLKKILPDATYISSKDYNLTSEKHVAKMFWDHKPDTVIHLAAKVGGIIDNINKPYQYFTDNVMMNTLLVDYSLLHGVKRFIGILSTCIYPDVSSNYPMVEEQLHEGPPTATNFSYGYAKRCLAVQIDACNKQRGTTYQYLTPCNLYGEYDKDGINSHFVAALLKKIYDSQVNNEQEIVLYGTGKPLRQFMYAGDLAWVIKFCLDNDITESFNVATEENHTIEEIAEIAVLATKAEIMNIRFDATKPDGQYRKDVSIEKLKSLIPEFKPTTLFKGIVKTYEYLKENE